MGANLKGGSEDSTENGGKCAENWIRTSSTTTRDRNLQFRGAVSTGDSPLDFCLFSSVYVQFSKTSPLKSGESSEKSSGENRVKSCHVCGCHGFFGPDRTLTDVNRRYFGVDGRFSAVNRRYCRRFTAKKGPGNVTPKRKKKEHKD